MCHLVGPSLSSQVAVSHDLEVSLLERLFERPLYKDHPLSREKHAQGSQLTRDLGKQFVPFANLVKVSLLRLLYAVQVHLHPAIELPKPPRHPHATFSHVLQRFIATMRCEWRGPVVRAS